MPWLIAYLVARSGDCEPMATTSWPRRRMAGIIRVAAMSLAPISPQRIPLMTSACQTGEGRGSSQAAQTPSHHAASPHDRCPLLTDHDRRRGGVAADQGGH